MLDITARPEIMPGLRFRLRLLGPFRLAGPAGRIELGSRKLAALLAWLVCAGEPQPRDAVMTLLWGSRPQPNAQQSLRQALMRLRRALGEDAIVSSRDRVGIRPGLVDCDVAAFERLIAAQSLDEALKLYAGSFLADVSLADDEEWAAWARAQQGRLEALALDAAVTLAGAELDAGRSPRALEAAQRALAIDNLREDAHRLAIAALAAGGRRADALKHFEDLSLLLKAELDVAPEPETQRLVQEIRLSGSLPAAPEHFPEKHVRDPDRGWTPVFRRKCDKRKEAPPAPAPPPERPSIAVLPFADNSETDQRYFADGIVEDIVLSLASLHELTVISRGSTLGLRAEGSRIDDVGRALGVRYLVTGSIRRAGGQLRVWVELSDTGSGETVWTDRMDVATGEVFAVQDQIVADTVARIAPSVRNAELKRALRKPPETLSAYDAMLRALDLIAKLDREAFERAASFLYQAREIEPAFALPHAWAAWIHMYRTALGWSRDPRADIDQAEAFAQAAVRLDGRNARALATLGHLRAFFHHDHDVGRQYVADALMACPNDPFCWAMSSAGASYLGRHAEAVLHAQKALRLSPFDKYRFYYRAALGLAHYVAGGYAEAIRCGRIAVDENPAFTSNLRYLAASLAASGELLEARAVGRALLAQQPGFNLQAYRARIPFRTTRCARCTSTTCAWRGFRRRGDVVQSAMAQNAPQYLPPCGGGRRAKRGGRGSCVAAELRQRPKLSVAQSSFLNTCMARNCVYARSTIAPASHLMIA